MQTTIKNLITKAVMEIEEETRGAPERTEETKPLSGNEFLEALFKKLFPEAPAATPVKKPRAKKEAPPKTPEPAPPAKDVEVDSLTESVESMTIAETPVKTVVVEEPKKAPRAKKEKGPENLAKLTPTQAKKLKQFMDERKLEGDQRKPFIEYVNLLTADDFNAKKLDQHMREFVARIGASTPEPVVERDRECIKLDFEGKTYYVSPEDKKVYAEDEEEGVHVFVGYAGMAAFEKMKVPV